MTDWLSTFENDNILVDLSESGLISVTGEDAKSFLQGQVTNDVNTITATQSQYSGYCNPKGRLLALFFAFQHQDTLYLSLDKALVASTQKRLQMYVMRAKVTLADEQTNIARFGIAGDTAPQQLQKHYPNLPETDFEVTQHGEVTIIRMPLIKPAYQVITHAEHRDQVLQTLSGSFSSTDKAAWDYLETQSGIPEIVAATQAAFVPQMVNLDALGGINYKKGCYTGQEIVARTHYLGKVKRRTLLGSIKTQAGTTPTAGDNINDATQQNIGQVVRCCANTEGGMDFLFECRLDSQDQTLYWQGLPITLKTLPYALAE